MDREIDAALKSGADHLKHARVLDAQREFYRAVDASGKDPAVKLSVAELWRKSGWAATMGTGDPETGWAAFLNARNLYASLDGPARGKLWEVERGLAIAAGMLGEQEEALRCCGEAELHAPGPAELAKVWNTRSIALSMLDSGRMGVAAQALGVMTAAYHEAVEYAQLRQAWGAPIARLQSIQFKLAEMERRVMSARLLIQRAAWLKDTGRDFIRAASIAKLYATEAATYVTHQAVQVHGGYGYVKDYAVERYYRDARVMEIYEGTSEIQRLVIARSLLKDGVKV